MVSKTSGQETLLSFGKLCGDGILAQDILFRRDPLFDGVLFAGFSAVANNRRGNAPIVIPL